MHISWHGAFTVKIVAEKQTLVLDPYAPSIGLPPFRAKAELVGLTNPSDSTMSHTSSIQGEPDLIDSPGEYSINGFTLHAMPWRADNGSERNVQRWHIEELTLLHVGALNRELSDKELQELERTTIDVLLVPVGGGNALNTKQAIQLVTTIEPRVVIPLNYQLPKLKDKLEPVTQFAAEMGIDPKQAESKTIIKAGKLPTDEIQTIILKP